MENHFQHQVHPHQSVPNENELLAQEHVCGKVKYNETVWEVIYMIVSLGKLVCQIVATAERF